MPRPIYVVMIKLDALESIKSKEGNGEKLLIVTNPQSQEMLF